MTKIHGDRPGGHLGHEVTQKLGYMRVYLDGTCPEGIDERTVYVFWWWRCWLEQDASWTQGLAWTAGKDLAVLTEGLLSDRESTVVGKREIVTSGW
jgi:hypothetical protein